MVSGPRDHSCCRRSCSRRSTISTETGGSEDRSRVTKRSSSEPRQFSDVRCARCTPIKPCSHAVCGSRRRRSQCTDQRSGNPSMDQPSPHTRRTPLLTAGCDVPDSRRQHSVRARSSDRWTRRKKGRASLARPYDATKLGVGYHPRRNPNRKNRSSMPSRPVLLMRFRIMNAPRVTFRSFGLSKCGVFVMLKPSALTCNSSFSVI